MSAAYTPGPLTVRLGANGDVGIIATAQQVVANDDIGGALVAECYCEIRRAGEGARAEALANATLYAAAPQMLAELLLAREYVWRAFNKNASTLKAIAEQRAAGHRLDQIDQAIWKATGQQGATS